MLLETRFEKIKGEAVEKIGKAFESVLEDLDGPVRNNPKTSIVIATLLGFFLADRII